jgi:small subunit ribosomal protein S9
MADDPKTPEQDETSEGQEPQAAGPVAEEGSSSSQAAGEDPSTAPPAAEESEDRPSEDAAAEEPDQPSEEGAPEAEERSEEAEEEGAPEAEERSEEAEEEGAPKPRAERSKEEKKDVIPGADLEPILVEPEAPELSAEERARLEAEEEEKARREAELAATEDAEAAAASRAPAKIEAGARFLATGKRKSSIARVTLVPGDGKIEINKRSLEEFFPRPLHQTIVKQPLVISGYEGNVDVRVRVHGGGVSGQAGAVRHGVARALTEIDAELRSDLKRRGFLTRDARVKERRKAGLKKARKRPQFSKR